MLVLHDGLRRQVALDAVREGPGLLEQVLRALLLRARVRPGKAQRASFTDQNALKYTQTSFFARV